METDLIFSRIKYVRTPPVAEPREVEGAHVFIPEGEELNSEDDGVNDPDDEDDSPFG